MALWLFADAGSRLEVYSPANRNAFCNGTVTATALCGRLGCSVWSRDQVSQDRAYLMKTQIFVFGLGDSFDGAVFNVD
jgi:hypothetical protein